MGPPGVAPGVRRGHELSLQTRLREAGYAPELVAAALLQSQLRARAQDKFGTFADGMLFTADGLEQATRFAVAARHAARYLRAEVRLVHDLGCGIGADAMAFAGLDLAVRAVDADAVTATVAGVNLRHWPAAQVVHGRAEDVVLPTGEEATHTGVWVDPARRLDGPADARGRSRRVFSLDRISPTWRRSRGMRRRCRPPGRSWRRRSRTRRSRRAPRRSGCRGGATSSSARCGGDPWSRPPDGPRRCSGRVPTG